MDEQEFERDEQLLEARRLKRLEDRRRRGQIAELTVGARADDDLIDVTEQESEVKFQFEEEDTSTDDATGEFSQVYTYIIYK